MSPLFRLSAEEWEELERWSELYEEMFWDQELGLVRSLTVYASRMAG